MKTIIDTLPSKPSELLALGLADLAKVERSKKYIVAMGVWHNPIDGLCQVCLAGSVLAKSLKLPFNINFLTADMDDSIRMKLYALNNLRLGYVSNALFELGYRYKTNLEVKDRVVTGYADDKKAWRNDMLEIIHDLKKLDL
jgi:hypothetical protein